MKSKRIVASLFFLLSTSSYAMESAFIRDESLSHHATSDALHAKAFTSQVRFVNDDFVSNLRFLYGQKSWNPNISGHPQSILSYNFPIDAMTQFVHLLFPSPTGDYLVANQSSDIIAKTKASKFYDALVKIRAGEQLSVWTLFDHLFDHQLPPFVHEIIENKLNEFCIETFARAIKKLATQHQLTVDKALEHLQEDGVFQDGFFTTPEGEFFQRSLHSGHHTELDVQTILDDKIKDLKNAKKALEAARKGMGKKSQEEKRATTEINQINKELEKLNLFAHPKSKENRLTIKHAFQGYQIARAFLHAFLQEQDGDYSLGTLERILATYLWQKAETIDDLPFLSRATVIDHDAMKDQIRPLIDNPELLQSYYDAGRHDIIWAYIYRERLMLDAKDVPVIKYRTTTVDGYSFSDCFETAKHNAADFFCFLNGSFEPNIWKEHSDLHQYFSKFKHTTPNDPQTRSEWAAAVAKRKDQHTNRDVLYYSPSKKMNDKANTIESVPGIINMFKIMAHLGGATDETWAHIAELETLTEELANEQLSAAFQLLIDDITENRIVFENIRCSNATKIADRSPGYSDFTGTFYVTVKDRLPFEWEFMHKHSVFKSDKPVKAHDERVAVTLSQLPLFAALRSHYSDLKALITREMSRAEVTTLLMESDLKSPDLRREIMPILLELHLDLPLLKNILKQIEKENDSYESKEILKLFNQHINDWLDDPVKRPIVMSLIRSAPKLFATEYGSQSNEEERVLYRPLIQRFKEKNDTESRELAIELMQEAHSINFLCGTEDPIMSYVHFFNGAGALHNIPLFDAADQLFDFSPFRRLTSIGFNMSKDTASPHVTNTANTLPPLSTEQIDEFVTRMADSIERISFNDANNSVQLLNAYAIFNKMKETRTDLDLSLHANIPFVELIKLKDENSALFEWAAQKMQSFCDMNFIHHPDQMHLFNNISDINNFQFMSKNGTINRSLFRILNHFEKLRFLSISCTKWDMSISDDTSCTTSFDEIIAQLPRSLETISFHNLYSAQWDELEPFIETLVTKKPWLKIKMSGSKTLLGEHPRMMALIDAGQITAQLA